MGNVTSDLFRVQPGNVYRYVGNYKENLDFIYGKQLKRPELWARFVEQFRSDTDYEDGWRGEFWGKMMRGACLVYACERDGELYQILSDTVRDMMSTQDELGRISTYGVYHEFHAWDLWCRKYVLLGMEYFLEICGDPAFTREIITCMEKQVDYLIEKIGRGEGQIRITKATKNWRGLNSSSILEPVVRLYQLTEEKRYLDFAGYIVSEGGTDVADVFELAYEDELYPYQYPATKAYEMTSCFEGLLEYYRVTGEEKYRDAVVRYAYKVLESDFTVIGSSGCTHELFDHSTWRQANGKNGVIQQETCVTVTLMKFFLQVLRITGDKRFADAFERAYYNAYLGSFNTEGIIEDTIHNFPRMLIKEPLPFDSYSPLAAGKRGNGVGGLKDFKNGNYYGCCACIASAGMGLTAPMSVMASSEGPVVNLYFPGEIETRTRDGQRMKLEVETKYPVEGLVKIRISLENEEEMTLRLRHPDWCRRMTTTLNGNEIPDSADYVNVTASFKEGDEIVLDMEMETRVIRPVLYDHDILHNQIIWDVDIAAPYYDKQDPEAKNRLALQYGPLVLAEENRLGYDVEEPMALLVNADDTVSAEITSGRAPYQDLLELRLPLRDGSFRTVTDYASAGRLWNDESRMAAWMNIEPSN